MPNLVLGLDLGPNSIGWALINDNEEPGGTSDLVDMGVRVFPEGVDAFDTGKEKPRNESRRVARGMRRQIRRRSRRRRHLMAALICSNLWPSDPAKQKILLERDPYDLRERALTERLEPFEIGRILLHLNQRRGFLSNRKKDQGDKEVVGMLAEINQNERERIDGGFQTIGAYLAHKHRTLDHRTRSKNDRVRGRHLDRRKHIIDEFNKVWDTQAKFHPELLNDRLKYGSLSSTATPHKPISAADTSRRGLTALEAFGLFGIIFFQRKMYWPKSVIGLCELESKEKRCQKSDRHAELFRLLQELNNLRFTSPDEQAERSLSDDQRHLLLDHLGRREKLTFDEIRKKLGFDSVKFNLERGKRPSIKGRVVDSKMAKAVGKKWHERPEDEKDAIVRMLLDHEQDDDVLVKRLTDEFGMDAEDAAKALDVDLPPGYVNLSLKAIDKLLPHLERGLIYQSISDPEKSALHAAGYLRRDELQRRLFDKLPELARVNPRDCKLGDIPNPVVKRALVELRKVVNAIIREYGRPDAVHVEMARSVQMGHERRKEHNARIRAREADRQRAAQAIRDLGFAVRRDSITRYLLWEEQGYECIYCGRSISQQQLFGGEVDVDHILPRSRCLDNSSMNLVVCHRTCNHDKGNQTPYEWLAAADPTRYEQVCLHAKRLMPYTKYRRFLQKELKLDDFVARQLTDTAYITRATVEYLRLLFQKDHAVLGLKGQLTAELRYQWGLDTVLQDLPDSPAWQQQPRLRPGEKNRADHRHHMIDALVIALTNRRRLQKLSDIYKRGGARSHGEILEDPWPDFRESVLQRARSVKVSHRVDRKVRGELHEQTLYGQTTTPGEWVLRKPLVDLSPAEVERIRDPNVRRIVLQTLREKGIDFGRGKKPDKKKMKQVLADVSMPSGVPIKKVRLIKPERTIQPLRSSGDNITFVKPGSTHHLCIFEIDGKKETVFVTMLEAAHRIKRREPIIQRTHPKWPDAQFILSLSKGELVLANWDGQEKLLVYKTAASTQGQIRFVEHCDARRSSEQKKLSATANTLDARKVTVDLLGRIRWAND